MSINGSVASFLPFTINGLTDASFSNSVLGNAIATTLQVTSATPLTLARFNEDRELVSASVDESQVALLVGGNVFNGAQTILPGSSTNINNVITTAITAEAYGAGSFTTSGISGYTAPLGTLTGPVSGEYSIGQTANDRTVMRINGFVPTVRAWTYTFTIRCVDVEEAYLSVEQSGVQRSSAIRRFTAEDTVVSDTFTYDPTSGPIVFKIYSGSLDPWEATWSSFTLGSYNVAITAPLSAPLLAQHIVTSTLSTQILTFPSVSSITSESWSVYAISTMGNPSSLGGLIFQESTLGVGAYITGGVVGATSFRFNTLSGNAGKVVVTNGDQVMSTSISAGQLDYITALSSQAGGVGQANTWTDANNFTSTTSVGALRITSSASNVDYSVSVNGTDFLEFTNLLSLQKVVTDGDSFWVPNRIFCNSTIYTSDLQMGSAIYFAYGSGQQWATLLNGSGEYVIQDDVGDTRFKLSKTTGLTVSRLNVTAVPSAAPTLALGVDGSGGVVSFAVPAATNLLPLDNTWTGTNTFQSTVSILDTTTTSIAGYTTAILQTAGITSQAAGGTAVISGAYILTPTPTTSPFAACYSPTQNFITGGNYRFRFTGFTTGGFFGVTLTMRQANVANTSSVAISASLNTVTGVFTDIFTPNINPSFLGQVYLQFQGTANRTIGWTAFAYEVGSQKTTGAFEVNGIANINGGTNFAVLNNYMQTGSLTIGDNTRNYGGGAFWNANTAGLLMECLDNTEIAVHDAGARVASLMYYNGASGNITMGRDMGWGVSNVATAGNLFVPAIGIIEKTGGNSGANYFRIIGNDAGSSPYLEYYFNNQRRMYIGNTTATEAQIATENGAQLAFMTGGASRMTITAGGDTSTSGKLTVQDVIRFGNYAGGNYDNIQFMRGTGSGQYPNIRCQNNYIAMFVSDVGGWMPASQVGDMVFLGEAGRNLRLGVGAQALQINSSNDLIMTHQKSFFLYNFGASNNAGFKSEASGDLSIFTGTAGVATRMTIKQSGDATYTSGDNSYIKYGPNSLWGASLIVGAADGTDKSGPLVAAIVSTDSNLHLDGGNSKVIYYGYYSNSRGTPNPHRFYGSEIAFASGLPQQNTTAIAPICFNGSQLFRSANINNVVYSNNGVSWAGGVYVSYAFYRTNAHVSTLIHGKLSYYVGGGGLAFPTIRVIHQATGQTWDYDLRAYFNVPYSHTTFPIGIIFNSNNTLTTGWYDVYVFNGGGVLTDGNDQLWILANTSMSNQFV
jgi:hypothetical protein